MTYHSFYGPHQSITGLRSFTCISSGRITQKYIWEEAFYLLRAGGYRGDALTDVGVLSANFFNCECVLRDFYFVWRFWKPSRESVWDDTGGFICIKAWAG